MIIRVFFLFFVFLVWTSSASASERLSRLHNYLVYYGFWDEIKIQKALEFELIILAPGSQDTNINADLIARLKKGKDGIAGTADDIIVLAYASVGEDGEIERGPRTLKVGYHGPVHQDATGKMVPSNNGFRDWYIDDMKYLFTKDNNKVWGEDGVPKSIRGIDKVPDENGRWHSYFVNVSDLGWQAHIKKRMKKYLDVFKCDGLFLDTIDTVSPWGAYGYMQAPMVDLLVKIRSWFPQSVIVMNRGLFLFEKYGEILNKNMDGVMFESYLSEWDWYGKMGIPSRWFGSNQFILHNHIKPLNLKKDGITVLFLHYFSQLQPEAPLFNYSLSQTSDLRAIHYVTDPGLSALDGKYQIVKQPKIVPSQLPPMQNFKISLAGWEDTDHKKHLWFSLKKVSEQFTAYPFMWLVPPGDSFSLADVEAGEYDLQVRQVNTQGKLLRAGNAHLTIAAQDRPAKVQGLQVQVHDKGLLLRWTAVPGADKYLIKWSNNRFSMNEEACVSKATNYFSNLKNDTVYYFKVAAVAGKKVGYPSDVYYAAPTDTIPPKTPTLISVKVVGDCIDIRWQASLDAAGYLVYVDPIELTQGLPLQIPLAQTNRCVKVPKAGKYVVRLAAFDDHNNESPSTMPVTVNMQ